MTTEEIIKDEASKFSKFIKRQEKKNDGVQEFKRELTSVLYDYYDNIDKLIFLYETNNQIERLGIKHLDECHDANPEKCQTNVYYIKCRYFTEQEIRELNLSFDFTVLRPNINSSIIKENLVKLIDFPEAAKLFQSAMDKLNESRFERNLLDDLRLSLEFVSKNILGNSKSLENQISPLGEYLKLRGSSKELINMFVTLTDYYSKYQNTYVKHNDAIKENEVDLLVNLTSAFISFLINK